jgi:diguanylate cyclase (GGDEF)-like protein
VFCAAEAPIDSFDAVTTVFLERVQLRDERQRLSREWLVPIHRIVVQKDCGGPGMLNSLLERAERLPRPAVLLFGLTVIAGLAVLDVVTGPKLLLNVFYLLPVMLVAWVTASTAYGLVAVLATFLVGPLEAYLDGTRFLSLPMATWNAGMRTAVFCIVLVLLAELRKVVARLREQSLSDELTGVANRRAFLEVAGREIERSRRYHHELSLAYLDIDDFKGANDRGGHALGDRVLIALAGLAHATARSVDTVARIGGDEFVILMPETDAAAALPLAERLCEACSRAAVSGGRRITCSIGLVTFMRPPSDSEELLANADALMYEAKAAGGDGVRHARVEAAEPAPADGRLVPFAHRSEA